MDRKNRSKDSKTKNRRVIVLNEGPIRALKVMSWLLIIMAILTIVYWILFHMTSIFWVKDVEMFKNFKAPFLLGSIWLIIVSLTAGIQLLVQKEDALVYGILAGSTLVAMGLIQIHFNIMQGVYSKLGLAMGIETFINLAAIIFGGYIITFFWNNREHILEHRDRGPTPPVKRKKRW